MINSCTEVWQGVCRELGWRIDESIQDAPHWKGVYLKAKLRMMQLKDQEAFETSSLIGHSARVYALYYKDGLLCTGTLSGLKTVWFILCGCLQCCQWSICPFPDFIKFFAYLSHLILPENNVSGKLTYSAVSETHRLLFTAKKWKIYSEKLIRRLRVYVSFFHPVTLLG